MRPDSEVVEADTTTSVDAVDGEDDVVEGHPIQIITVDPETREFVLQEDELSRILLSDKCKDRPVSVVSIAGDFRKGKSFLLNFLLRYLNSKGYESATWLQDRDLPLKGFSWRGGAERDTTGILMWSEPFIVPLQGRSHGPKEAAVLLMDTQGAFDSEYTVKDSATVFALSTMTSSIQVFNVLHNLQEDNLQVLQTFTEYGRLAMEESEETPFQNLIFLVRDWSFAYEHEFGLKGGAELLEKKLIVNDRQPMQLQRVRKHIRSCFNSITCFLMPHPGKTVATNPKFDGRIASIDEDFLEQLQVFVPILLSPKSLVVKQIGGSDVTGRQLLEYFKVYINIFKGESMPEPKSMLEATAEANNRAAVALARDHYSTSMEQLCGGNMPFIHPKELEKKHLEVQASSIELFEKTRKMGGREYSEAYLTELRNAITEAWTHFDAQNNSKNVFSLLGAPAVLLVWTIVCFILSRIFEIIGIMFVSNLFMFFGTASLVLTITYMFFRSVHAYVPITSLTPVSTSGTAGRCLNLYKRSTFWPKRCTPSSWIWRSKRCKTRWKDAQDCRWYPTAM